MKASLHLTFDGDGAEALEFYERALGAKVVFRLTWGESPMAAQGGAALKDKIMHARFELGGQEFLVGDAPPGRYEKPQGLWASLETEDPAEAERVHKALAEGGRVTMDLQETFWARRFGMLYDRFGIPWMINCGKPLPRRAQA